MSQRPETPPTSLSFEQLLGWMGRFTPQFKFRLMAYRRQVPQSEFDQLVRDALGVFRNLLVELARVPKGPARARRVFTLMDQEYQATPPVGISCAAGCGACCRSFAKAITDDEADVLAMLVKSGEVSIDLESLKAANEKSACAFLGADNRCQVYADRPSVCRKYHVTSPREACESESEGVVPQIELMPELIVSAAITLPDNQVGPMNEQLLKRLV